MQNLTRNGGTGVLSFRKVHGPLHIAQGDCAWFVDGQRPAIQKNVCLQRAVTTDSGPFSNMKTAMGHRLWTMDQQ